MKPAVLVAVLVIAAAAAIFIFEPPCLFLSLTGLQCPGCGSTRALKHLLRGELREAWRMNALFVAMLPVVLTGAIAAPRIHWRWWMVWVAGVVVVGWGVWRNL